MQLQLQGRTVLLTGGTKGIGKATCEAFLNEGCKVAYCARNVSGNEFESKPGTAKGTALDITNLQELKRWIHDSAALFGGIDIVVNNASYITPNTTIADWIKGFETDILPYVTMVEETLPYLRKSSHPSIVSIGSESGLMVNHIVDKFGPGPYGAIKAAVIHYTQQLATKYAAEGIKVNSISPGHIIYPGGNWEKMQTSNKEFFDRIVDELPTKRMGTPTEVANMVLFLASPLSTYTVGTNVRISGGNTRGIQL